MILPFRFTGLAGPDGLINNICESSVVYSKGYVILLRTNLIWHVDNQDGSYIYWHMIQHDLQVGRLCCEFRQLMTAFDDLLPLLQRRYCLLSSVVGACIYSIAGSSGNFERPAHSAL